MGVAGDEGHKTALEHTVRQRLRTFTEAAEQAAAVDLQQAAHADPHAQKLRLRLRIRIALRMRHDRAQTEPENGMQDVGRLRAVISERKLNERVAG